MNIEMLNDLEEKIDRAVTIIAGLKNDKQKLERENESLRRQAEDFRKEFEDYKSSEKQKFDNLLATHREIDGKVIKDRLEKLVGKLAALEESWN